jgi:hypothetical protein
MWRGRETATVALCLTACAVWLVAALAAAPITRVFLLPASDRTSVVIELERAPKQAVGQPRGRVVVVNIGPLQGAVTAQQLRTANALVSSVTIAGATQPNGDTMARVEVALRVDADSQVRLVGSRVYIDIAPRRSSSSAERPAVEPPPPKPAASVPPEKPEPTPKRPAPPTPAKATDFGDAGVAAFLRRANALAGAGDVTGLERMKAEWERRDAAAAANDDAESVSGKLSKLLDEARDRRLAIDHAEFLEIEHDRYRHAIQRAYFRIAAIRSAVAPGAPPARERLEQVTADIASLLGAMRGLNAPAELRDAHQALVSGLDAALDVTTGRASDDRSRSSASALLDRAQRQFASVLP